MLRLIGNARHYDWGSTTSIPEHLGRRPDGQRVAELWFGAHPTAPATVFGPDNRSLDALLVEAPESILGAVITARYGRALPYLVKLLAAERPLSIQAHPTPEQAYEGQAREVARQVPPAESNYPDGRAKPETLVALAPTRVLAGFRSPDDIAEDLERIGSAALRDAIGALRDETPAAARVEAGFRQVLELDDTQRADALAALVRVTTSRPPTGSKAGAAGRDGGRSWGEDALEVAHDVQHFYPDDAGVLATVFLGAVELEPGQALDVGAGVVHCYLQGFGLEVMASSDNVLRAGLTSKHVDVPELVRVLNFEPAPVPVLLPAREADHGASSANRDSAGLVDGQQARWVRRTYPTAAREYQITIIDLATPSQASSSEAVADEVWTEGAAAPVTAGPGPHLVTVLSGAARLHAKEAALGHSDLGMARGEVVLLMDGEQVEATGAGRIAVVSVPAVAPAQGRLTPA